MNTRLTTKYDYLLSLVIIAATLFAGRSARADFTVSSAERLGPTVNSPNYEDSDWMPRLSADGLSLTVFRTVNGAFQVWVATRATIHAPWQPAIRDVAALGPPWVVPGVTTMDGLEFYGPWYDAPTGYGDMDLYYKSRETMDSPWSEAINIGPPVNTPDGEAFMSISLNGLELYFCDYGNPRPGGYGGMDLWVTRRTARHDPWQEPENLGSNVNSPAADGRPHISADGLAMFFDSNRSGGSGALDLYVARRRTPSGPWEEVMNLGPAVNSPYHDQNPGISLDGRELFFNRDHDIWQASVEPVVDFNADEIIDLVDLVMLIDNWGTDDTLYDIGPMPWGDGVVDVEDLKVFITHWEKENLADSESAE